MFTNPNLGHGIGLRNAHIPHYLEHGATGIDWAEIISENFFEPGGRPWVVLEKVRAEVPVVAHGVSLGIGNVDPLSDHSWRPCRRSSGASSPPGCPTTCAGAVMAGNTPTTCCPCPTPRRRWPTWWSA